MNSTFSVLVTTDATQSPSRDSVARRRPVRLAPAFSRHLAHSEVMAQASAAEPAARYRSSLLLVNLCGSAPLPNSRSTPSHSKAAPMATNLRFNQLSLWLATNVTFSLTGFASLKRTGDRVNRYGGAEDNC